MKALGIVPNWKKLNNAKIMVTHRGFCRAHGVQAYLLLPGTGLLAGLR